MQSSSSRDSQWGRRSSCRRRTAACTACRSVRIEKQWHPQQQKHDVVHFRRRRCLITLKPAHLEPTRHQRRRCHHCGSHLQLVRRHAGTAHDAWRRERQREGVIESRRGRHSTNCEHRHVRGGNDCDDNGRQDANDCDEDDSGIKDALCQPARRSVGGGRATTATLPTVAAVSVAATQPPR